MADLELDELKELHQKAFTHNQTTRINAADDTLFAFVTQWDSSYLDQSQIAYKGEFNIVRKGQRKILSDLRSNPVQLDFEPTATSREAEPELISGLYLTDDVKNTSIEAYENAAQECVVCGLGGWELYTEYESNKSGDKNQVIKRRAIYEFNNNAFPDPNAKLLDKSDAKYWSILEAYSPDGYKALYKDLTGEETTLNPQLFGTYAPSNFAVPENSYVFPWVTRSQLYYVTRFYHKSKVKDKILTLHDPLGQSMKLRESDLLDVMDELMEQGYEIVDEKKIKRWQIKCYIASGERILKTYIIPGENIPVIPMYGERQFVEGEECYEGVIRLAKDPQRLHNFLMSYIAESVSRGPRQKPIFGAEQVAGFENMYEQNGMDNNFPYLLQHLKDKDGNALPLGPVGTLNPPELNSQVATLLELCKKAVDDVLNPGLPNNIADPDLSGKALDILKGMFDEQSILFQDHLKHAKRYDGVCYSGIATEIIDAPRTMTVTLPDGSRKTVEIMQTIMDEETGKLKTLNDLTNTEWEVYAKIGPSYSSQKDKTRAELREMAAEVMQADPALYRLLMLKSLELMDGANIDDIKDYVRKQLLLGGFKKPETEEDEEFLQQAASQPQEPDAAMLLAQAENKKADAEILQQQREAMKDQQDAMDNQAKRQIDAFNAQTKRQDIQVRAAEAGVNIDLTRAKTRGQNVDNVIKLTQPYRARLNPTGRDDRAYR